MALTPEQIDAEVFARWGDMKGAPLAMCRGFARVIEAEVRKQDDALIRQMLEALKSSSPYADIAYRWKAAEWIKRRADAIASAESFLQETIQHPQPSPSSGAFLLPDEQELTHNPTGT